jgi:hypothetical protein
MITDCDGYHRYADKPFEERVKPPSVELKRLYAEMEANPNYHISRENSFYPRGFPSCSPGWGN